MGYMWYDNLNPWMTAVAGIMSQISICIRVRPNMLSWERGGADEIFTAEQ